MFALKPVPAARLPRSALTISAAGDVGVRVVDSASKVNFVPVDIVEDLQGTMWLAGLRDGAQVIVRGQDFVREGQNVTPVNVSNEKAQR